jgi:hypothetical protein
MLFWLVKELLDEVEFWLWRLQYWRDFGVWPPEED